MKHVVRMLNKLYVSMCLAAFAAVIAQNVSAEVITIPDGGTFYIGGTGADPKNVLDNYIVFTPGSTLVVTQINGRANIWPTLIATNGAAYVECSDPTMSPILEFNVFAYGAGSLTLRNMKQPQIGHDTHYPVLKLENLHSEGIDPIVLKSASLLSFPDCSYVFIKDVSHTIRLCGSNMYPNDDVITVDSGRCALQLCNPAAIPAGKTVRAGGSNFSVSPLSVPDPDDGIVGRFGQNDTVATVAEGCVYGCNVELPSGSTLAFAKSAAVTFNGSISGYNHNLECGDIALSGYKGRSAPVVLGGDNSAFRGRIYSTVSGAELVLSNANAAVNATIDMETPLAVCVAEGVPSVSVGAVAGAADVLDSVIRASSGQSVSVRSASGSVRACGTGVASVVVPKKGETVAVAGDGSFSVNPVSVLHSEVGYWFDFSRSDTRFRIGEGYTDAFPNEYAAGQPYVERVVDWRYPDATNCLWNRRLYQENGTYATAYSVYSYLAAGTQNGLQYISLSASASASDGSSGSSRRLPFSNGSGFNTVSDCSAQLVVMVFGAQNGGGWAMVGTTEGAFGRGAQKHTINDPITTNTAYDVWQDGVKVDPTTTKFKNGFQVMSVALDGLHFNGLGFRKDIATDPNEMGGQNYGEVLVFTNAVSEQVRLEAELYLARKWGLEAQYSPTAVAQLKALRAANPVCIATAGSAGTTINAGEQSVSVEGPFSGTVELDGGTLVVPDRPLPYAESDIPSAGRLYWADPDDTATVKRIVDDPFFRLQTVPEACTNEVRAILDKSVRSLAATVGNPLLYATGDRRPTPMRQSRGLGVERTWLDFNDYADTTLAGNTLRFVTCPALSDADLKNGNLSTLATMNVRTAFVVQDSVRGGGAPLLNNVFGTTYPKNRANGDYAQTIYPEDKPDELVNGENRLNGNVVDYTKGFLGQPEVFTVRGTGTYNLPFIGCYNNSGSNKNGEIIGEVLLYNTALSDDVVKGIEAYLMNKWIGRLPTGYADLRNATVTGSGTVQVAKGSQMPRISNGFEGSVAVAADGAFTMTIDADTGEVIGALDCPAATLSLPASCSITVNFTRSLPKSTPNRDYTLVDCLSGADGVEWTFILGENATAARCSFVKSGNKVLLKYVRPGIILTFR